MRIKNYLQLNRIRTKLVLPFLFMIITLFIINIFTTVMISGLLKKANASYDGNRRLNSISSALEDTHTSLWEYMKTGGTQSLLDYYRNAEKLTATADGLNIRAVDNVSMLLEKDLFQMVQTYLEVSGRAASEKRSGHLQQSSMHYKETQKLYSYVEENIGVLNTMQMQENSEKYIFFMDELKWVESVSVLLMVTVMLFSIALMLASIFKITKPVMQLVETANEISNGNYDVALESDDSIEEVAIMSNAFNAMAANIRTHIENITEKAELESRLQTQEIQNIKMKAALKDAQISSLQAQINPHFLFNTLNACAQLAMFEDAERTGVFIEKLSDYYRFSIRNMADRTTLADEIENVRNYMYIMKIRLGDRIELVSHVDETLLNVFVPSMILQPLVENAYIHGVDNMEDGGIISLIVLREDRRIVIKVRDNGSGMSQKTIRKLLDGTEQMHSSSGGIGFRNVLTRLRLFYGRDDVVDIYSEGEGQGTEIRVYLPIEIEKDVDENV